MTDRYERIRSALAMGPTPGPWGLKELPRDMQRYGYKFSISRGGLGWWIAKITHEANGGSGVANATYIAACDPDTIRALLEERDQLAAALAAAQQRIACLPADWREDSSLETWFPITAEEIESLRTENARLREDAERYRWLRDREIPEWLDLWHQNPDRIDAAIDEAMEKEVSND